MPAVWLHYCLLQHPFWEYNLKKQSYFFLPFSLPQFFIVLLGTGCSSWSPYIKPMFWDFFQGKLLSVSIEKINAACFHKNWFGRSGWPGAVGCVWMVPMKGVFSWMVLMKGSFSLKSWQAGLVIEGSGLGLHLVVTLEHSPILCQLFWLWRWKVFSLAKLSSS